MTKEEIANQISKMNLIRIEDNKNNLLHVVNAKHTINNAIANLAVEEKRKQDMVAVFGKEKKKSIQTIESEVRMQIESIKR